MGRKKLQTLEQELAETMLNTEPEISPQKEKKKKKRDKIGGSSTETQHESNFFLEGEKKREKKEKKKMEREEKKKEKKSKKMRCDAHDGLGSVKDVMNGLEKNGDEIQKDEMDIKKVVVSGKDSENLKYVALDTFVQAKLPDNVIECCKSFTKPSPIQAHAWPFLFDGRDFIGIAETGSGTVFF